MNIKEIAKEAQSEFEKIISFFDQDVATIRTGRANPSLIENVLVDSYGSKLPLKQLASISIAGPRSLLIQPWNVSILPLIEKALSQSDLGASPAVDNNMIRVNLPSLTEEYRKKLLKVLGEKAEAAKISLRRSREEFWRKIQDGFKDGEIREDDKFKSKDELQKLIDDYGKKIDELCRRKEQEIMEN